MPESPLSRTSHEKASQFLGILVVVQSSYIIEDGLARASSGVPNCLSNARMHPFSWAYVSSGSQVRIVKSRYDLVATTVETVMERQLKRKTAG
jgi:hypothetical protein